MSIVTSSITYDLLALLATVAVIVFSYFKWTYQYWKRKGVPYFEPSIPFGNLPNPITSELFIGEHVKQLYDQAKSKGWKACGFYLMLNPTYMVLDLELLKRVMTKDFSHFVDRGIYTNEKDDPISCTLFSLGGIKWKNLRAKLTPTFTSGKMKTMFQTIADCGTLLEKYVQDDLAGKEMVDIKEVLGRFSTDIIGSCAFGLECNSFKEPDSPFRIFGKKVLESTTFELIKEGFAISFPNLARSMGIRVFRKEIFDFYSKVVEDTISYREQKNVTRKDFLQLLMEMRDKEGKAAGDGNSLTMLEIIAQSFVFFIAGFETSSTTMTFALYELARNPDIQEKVRDEMRTVLAKHDDKITYDSMNELVYLRQVIDETLRMYPPLPILTRECIEDYKIPDGNFVIEKGTIIFIPVVGIHYDEDYYQNPTKFDPDRFSTENKQGRHQYAHLPFGEGPRICIGERFGVLQTKVGLTSVLRNFKVSVSDKTKVPLKMDKKEKITTAVGGIWLNIEKV